MVLLKRIERCKNAVRREAKRGKLQMRFTIYADEVNALEEEGFKVKVPKNFQNISKKNLVRVTIYWGEPTTTGGFAQQCKNQVKKFRFRMNAIKRSCKVKADKQYLKELVDEEEELSADDNEYGYYDD